MRRFLIVLLLCLKFTLEADSQPFLYGLTSGRNGTISRFDLSASSLTAEYTFTNFGSFPERGKLLQASNGKFYGTTNRGGDFNQGTLFSYDLNANVYTVVVSFNETNGAFPNGELIQASNGKIYGTTIQGGSGRGGVIFSYDPTSSTFSVVKNLVHPSTGTNIRAGLKEGSPGKLYGTTSGGGTFYGTIFMLDLATSAYTTLASFSSTNGSSPEGSLLLAADGKFYGTTASGGANQRGTLYSFDPVTNVITALKSFGGIDGEAVRSTLIQGSDGKLYGTTEAGGDGGWGVVFSYDLASNQFAKISLDYYNSGQGPGAGLVQANDGKLFGLSSGGGAYGNGTLFSVDPATFTFSTIKSLQQSTGSEGNGTLLVGADGKMYGVTREGGSSGTGVIFSFDYGTGTFTKLKDFDGVNGLTSYGALLLASDGLYYGLTYQGGSDGRGVLFRFDPNTKQYQKLKDLTLFIGGLPYCELMQAPGHYYNNLKIF